MQDINVQSISSLDYEFTCHYNDGSVMFQNYGKEDEKNFGHIDLDNLKYFELYNKEENKTFQLDLSNGVFYLNGIHVKFDLGFNGDKRITPDKYRLVYFRRVKQDFAPEGIIITVRFIFGWQTTVDGKNYQKLVCIESDGSVTIMDKK